LLRIPDDVNIHSDDVKITVPRGCEYSFRPELNRILIAIGMTIQLPERYSEGFFIRPANGAGQ